MTDESAPSKVTTPADLSAEAQATRLPDSAADLVPLDHAPPPVSEEIRKRMAELDMTSTQSIINFGASAQNDLTTISSSMLADVKNKNVGPAGDSLRTSWRRSAASRSPSLTCGAIGVGGKS